MTSLSWFGIVGSLAIVLGALVLTLRLLKRLAPRGANGRAVTLMVTQRVPVGPRQSIAIVQIGSRLVAVSTGEGGVRLISEVVTQDGVTQDSVIQDSVTTPSFKSALGTAIRRAIVPVVAVVSLGGFAPSTSAAQTTTQTSIAQSPAPKASKPASPARIDSLAMRAAPKLELSVGEKAGGLRLTGTVGIVVMMGLLTLLPALILMMTGFTRIMIVLNFLRQAIGAQSAPPTQLVAGMSLLLTLFVMSPTLEEVNRTAITPWMDGRIDQVTMLKEGVKPFREFMLRQTREQDLATFIDLSRSPRPASAEEVPLVVLTSAFVTSELRVAFQIGFALFLPFIVIDVVVASVLMSMGMMMVPPAMISLPFKLLLFVLVDGWTLVIHGLIQSFR